MVFGVTIKRNKGTPLTHMLDNQIKVETPESISLLLVPTGPIPRVLAYSTDLIIRSVILSLIAWGLSLLDEFGAGFYLLIYFVLDWFYCVLFEMLHNGQTPGKKTFNIQVVHDDGTPLSWGASILRNILRAVDFMPLAYIAGLISMVSNQQFKRLGDLAAGTMVVYCPKQIQHNKIEAIGSRPAPVPLALEEQQAIVAFAERSQTLSPQRQEELAQLLAPLLNRSSTSKSEKVDYVENIKKIANGIVGQL